MNEEVRLSTCESAWIVGIDLAWGPRSKDGICVIKADRSGAEIIDTCLMFGDEAFREWLRQRVPVNEPALLAIDAPLIVPNAYGSRPVDRQISADFMKYHAACHSANQTRCARPLRIAELLREEGFEIDYDLQKAFRIATEVYPHPATIRFFELDRIVKYKKGIQRKDEFKRLQGLLLKYLSSHPHIRATAPVRALLSSARNQANEDQVDALICSLIGYTHWATHGQLCEIVGTLEEGFILLPPVIRNGFTLMRNEPVDENHPVVTMEFVNRLRDEIP